MTNDVRQPPVSELIEAVRGHDIGAVERLLRHGVDVNGEDMTGCTALIQAAILGYKEMARVLIDNGADVNQKTVNFNSKRMQGTTALMEAARANNVEVARFLLDNGADINAANDYNATSLIHAAMRGAEEVLRLLIDRGADTSIPNRTNDTPRDAARQNGFGKLASLLEEAPARQRWLAEEADAARAAHAAALQKQQRLNALAKPIIIRRPQP